MKMATIDALGRSELFGQLDTKHLERLSRVSRGFSCGAGEVIFNEGDEAVDLYILTDGRIALEIDIQVVHDRPPVPTTVDLVGPGDCFGWSALVEPNVYTATARCMSGSTGVAISGVALREIMEENPALGREVMTRLAEVVSSRLALTRMRLTTQLARLLDREEW